MILKTQAIVLRHAPTFNTSRIAAWLTRDAGRVATVIKGSQRPKSLFLGQYDLFYTCELLYYARESRNLHIARECFPLKTRTAFRHDWRACATASYLCDLMWRISPPGAPHPELFDLLDTALDDLDQRGAALPILLHHELRLLDHMGLTPRLHHCLACNRPLETGRRDTRFSYTRGGLLCPACAERDHRTSHPIAPDVLAILRNWQAAPGVDLPRKTKCSARQLEDMEYLLGQFLSYHLEIPLFSRDIAFGIVRRDTPKKSLWRENKTT